MTLKIFDRLVVAFLGASVLEEFRVLYVTFTQYQYDANTKVPKNLFLFLHLPYNQTRVSTALRNCVYCANANWSRWYSSILDCELNPRPNTELFLVRIFLYSDWIQENTDQKQLRIWTLFTQWIAAQQQY